MKKRLEDGKFPSQNVLSAFMDAFAPKPSVLAIGIFWRCAFGELQRMS